MMLYVIFGLLFAIGARCDEGQPEVILFHLADTNHDDMLNRAELDELFMLFDTNNNTEITPSEFVSDWTSLYKIGNSGEAQALFSRADTNDDGVIDSLDIPAIFAFFDGNGDGHVGISEFLTNWGQLKNMPSGTVDISVDITG